MDPARLACVRHAASVRPEPGSNSPSRSRHYRRTGNAFDRVRKPDFIPEGVKSNWHHDDSFLLSVVFDAYYFVERHHQSQSSNAVARTWLLTFLCSVFKEHTY